MAERKSTYPDPDEFLADFEAFCRHKDRVEEKEALLARCLAVLGQRPVPEDVENSLEWLLNEDQGLVEDLRREVGDESK